MRMLQFYETTIFSASSEHAIHAVIIPRRSIAGPDPKLDVEGIVAALQLQKLTLTSITGSSLTPALAVISSPTTPPAEMLAHLTVALQTPVTPPAPSVATVSDREFAEHLAFDDLIPFEQSPISLESLGKLVVSATGAGIGAYAGFVMAGPTPLLLITIPAGMIICGAAKGIADALEKGLRERLLRFLKSGDEPTGATSNNTPLPTPPKRRS